MRTASVTPLRVAAAVLSLFLAPAVASAHALGADCTLRNGRVEVEAYYSDDTAARHATVRVLDAAEVVVAEGRTDERGRWSFAAPAPGRYAVVVEAGAGHRARVKFTVPSGGQTPPDRAPAPEENCTCRDHGSEARPETPTPSGADPSRQSPTAVPWLNVGLGLGTLAALGFGARRLSRAIRHRPVRPTDPGSVPGRPA